MPGVPSGRGCNACRAQKKKCDQAKPLCSRCSRLQIICIGSGQQRYKFKHSEPSWKLNHDQRRSSAMLTIYRPPSNAQTLLTSALIDKLQPSADLRYHLSWTYGGYLEDIPRRLGRSDALDAAVDALVYAHSRFARGWKEICPEALRRYSHAIATLRVSLDDPYQARTAETLCAVTLLLLCQVFTGVYEGLWTSHCNGAAQVLKVRGYYDKNNKFECKLLLALRGSVLFQALLSDKISMSDWEWEQIVENDLDGSSYEGRMMGCLARVPDLMQRARDAARDEYALVELQNEARCLYDAMKLALGDLRDRFVIQEAAEASSMVAVMVHSHYQRTYGLALAISNILNCILSILDPQDISLVWDATRWSDEILVLAEKAALYRPIAASYMTLCLISAWGCSREGETKLKVKTKLEDYLQDFSYTKVEVLTTELDAIFSRLRLGG